MCITCLIKRDIVRPNSNTLLLPTPRKTFVLTMNATKLAYAIRRKARSPANLSVIDPLSRLQSSLCCLRQFFYDFGWCEMVVSVSPLNQATKHKEGVRQSSSS
jgi:hypothetical protein